MKPRSLVPLTLLAALGLWAIAQAAPIDAQRCSRRCARDAPRDERGCCVTSRGPRPSRAPSCGEGRVLVPGGTFSMGTPHPQSLPGRVGEETVGPFCIDRTEVTVEAYGACVARGRCTAPNPIYRCPYERDPQKPQVCVRWHEAARFCREAHGRLPTEAEWELAARGTDGRTFPWGDEPPSTQPCWSGGTRRTELCVVGSSPADASPYGVLDMAGNATEWTADAYGAPQGPVHRIIRGGNAFQFSDFYMMPARREAEDPEMHHGGLGFRCASDVRP